MPGSKNNGSPQERGQLTHVPRAAVGGDHSSGWRTADIGICFSWLAGWVGAIVFLKVR